MRQWVWDTIPTIWEEDIMAWCINEAGECRMDILDAFVQSRKEIFDYEHAFLVQNKIYLKRYSKWAQNSINHWHNYTSWNPHIMTSVPSKTP